MRSMVLSATLTALIAICSVSAHAQIYNGSFEDGDPIATGAWLTLSSGSSAIYGWSIDQGSIDYIGGWWPASHGDRNVDLSGMNAGGVSQMVSTVPGSTYTVSFDMSGNPDGAPFVKQLTVRVDGGQAATFTYDITAHQNTRADMKWVRQSYTFVAETNFTVLSFTSDSDTPYGAALDNVSMELVPVGEPLSGICHRNNGKKGSKTLYVDPAAYPAHMAHGDTAGPCETE